MTEAEAIGIHRHTFLRATTPGRPPLLLLHRTGGDEMDLVPLARRISPGSAILAITGNVLEEGRPRFFKRIGQGDFDIKDLRLRMAALESFVAAACRHYGIARPVALGHSNGANILWPLLLAGTDCLAGAILFRPMLAFEPDGVADLSGFPLLITAGSKDTIVTPDRAEDLPNKCRRAGAHVTYAMMRATHDLVDGDETAAARWLQGTFAPAGAVQL